MPDERLKPATAAVAVSLILLFGLLGYFVARRVVSTAAARINRRAAERGGDGWLACTARQPYVLTGLTHLAPATLVYLGHLVFPDYWVHERAPDALLAYPTTYGFWSAFLEHMGLAYLIVALTLVGLGMVRVCRIVWHADENESTVDDDHVTETTALSGILSFARASLWVAGTILVIAALTGRNPLVIVGSVGVFMAIFTVVFRDALLGLVASVEIVRHDIVRVGDWIEMPRYGADGNVRTITLGMIKVENFDKSITTIPTHAVLSEDFRNWSSMVEVGGRRIKRALFVDMRSIRPSTPEDASRFADRIRALRGDSGPVAEHDTNVGWFREYVAAYLRFGTEGIHDPSEWTFIVRHLAPTAKGLPLEICAFCKRTDWSGFEAVQAEVFEHLLAVLPEFGLEVFQDPARLGEATS